MPYACNRSLENVEIPIFEGECYVFFFVKCLRVLSFFPDAWFTMFQITHGGTLFFFYNAVRLWFLPSTKPWEATL